MADLAAAMIYIAFFSLIAFCCYATKSALPLWGLLLMPTIKTK